MLVVLFVITFSLANTEQVHLKYYDLLDVTLASYLLIFISFGIGLIIGGLFGIVERWRLSRMISHLKKQVRDLEADLEQKKPIAEQFNETASENRGI